MALERVQPVPWVVILDALAVKPGGFSVGIQQVICVADAVTAFYWDCTHSSLMMRAACCICWEEWISIPESSCASGMFGVMTVAIGRRTLLSRLTASERARTEPLVATTTGSTTIFCA